MFNQKRFERRKEFIKDQAKRWRMMNFFDWKRKNSIIILWSLRRTIIFSIFFERRKLLFSILVQKNLMNNRLQTHRMSHEILFRFFFFFSRSYSLQSFVYRMMSFNHEVCKLLLNHISRDFDHLLAFVDD